MIEAPSTNNNLFLTIRIETWIIFKNLLLIPIENIIG